MFAPLWRWIFALAFSLALGSDAAMAQSTTPSAGDAPIPVSLPRDDGPHSAAGIEWWYFTGHLQTDNGDHYGFEYVVFRARPGGLEGYVSHFAISDDSRGVFRYDQRILGTKDVITNPDSLDLQLGNWSMRGGNGDFALRASMPDYALDVDLTTTRPPALHDGDGYIDYGNGTATYYYSWTRMQLRGTLTNDAGEIAVTGTAWMDHQWGDFLTYQEGGWDWFAVQLDNGVDVMVYLVRGPNGSLLRVDGSIVAADGAVTILRRGGFAVAATGQWQSPHTGTVYPSGWQITIPGQDLTMTITPTMRDQELDTRATTGVIYWEGEATVTGTIHGRPVAGRGYAELTGYAPYQPGSVPSQATPAAALAEGRGNA